MQTTQDRVPNHLLTTAEFGDLKFPAPECLLMVQVCLAPGRNAGAPCCTTEVCNAHKTSLREVKYRWHAWHGKTVLVRGEACRGGRVVLQCVRDELKGFPTLEIPEWMFDSRVCSRMYSTAFPHVDCASLLTLKHLISAATGSSELNVVQAQHPGKSGDAIISSTIWNAKTSQPNTKDFQIAEESNAFPSNFLPACTASPMRITLARTAALIQSSRIREG